MNPIRPFVTTGYVARLCRVTARTAAAWCDSGSLKAYSLPGSQERRVLYEDLVSFLQRSGLSYALRELDATLARQRVLLFGLPTEFTELLTPHLPDTQLVRASRSIEAGAEFERSKPTAVIIDFAVTSADARAAASWLITQSPRPRIAGVIPADWSERLTWQAEAWGFERLWKAPADPVAIARWVLEPQQVVEEKLRRAESGEDDEAASMPLFSGEAAGDDDVEADELEAQHGE